VADIRLISVDAIPIPSIIEHRFAQVKHGLQTRAGRAKGRPHPVMVRRGPADLETLDTPIAAGFAANRAHAVRWGAGPMSTSRCVSAEPDLWNIGSVITDPMEHWGGYNLAVRIRERLACADLREHAIQIENLRSRF
jgi:hypothetical protein